ncbi:hypothetical protein A4G26_25840 [Mycobacterium kansasii]|uniref:hypothetical protein n=1 Tax=Mycobacterium innocens TaxID=2341083 RepID=UPI0007BE8668|nr:hypothetical protein [Mycobacterium innocens]KZS70027.1 hypothetical protein A4G26_25840 [Mycobacterium kansasii]
MTADPGRALSSIDLLDEEERFDLATIGNRAVLTNPHQRRCRSRPRWPPRVARTPDIYDLSTIR